MSEAPTPKENITPTRSKFRQLLRAPMIVFFIWFLSLAFMIHRVTWRLRTPDDDYAVSVQRAKEREEHRKYLLTTVLNGSKWNAYGAVVSFTGDGKVLYEGRIPEFFFQPFIETPVGFEDEFFPKEEAAEAINETVKNCSELEKIIKKDHDANYRCEGRFTLNPECVAEIGIVWDKIENASNPAAPALTSTDFGRVTSILEYEGGYPHGNVLDSIFPPVSELSWTVELPPFREIKEKK